MLNRPTFYVAVLGVIAVVLLVVRLRQSGPESTPVVPPPQSPYAEAIGARGLVESVDENVRVAPSAAGLIEKVVVAVGDVVKTGDVLFTMDSRDLRAALQTREAGVAVEEARVAEARTVLADRQDQFDRSAKLREKNVSSVDETRRFQFALQTAQRQIERSLADLTLAKAQLNDARVKLDLLTVRAPRDGTVLQVSIRAGEYVAVNATDPSILLGDIRTLQLRADVDESDASRVRKDCSAVAFLKGTQENPIPLEFVRIEPYVLPKRSLTGESTERVDTRVLQIIFKFSTPDFPVYVGQQMDVFIKE